MPRGNLPHTIPGPCASPTLYTYPLTIIKAEPVSFLYAFKLSLYLLESLACSSLKAHYVSNKPFHALLVHVWHLLSPSPVYQLGWGLTSLHRGTQPRGSNLGLGVRPEVALGQLGQQLGRKAEKEVEKSRDRLESLSLTPPNLSSAASRFATELHTPGPGLREAEGGWLSHRGRSCWSLMSVSWASR